MSSGFKKIRHNKWTIYMAEAFLNHGLGQVILAGEEKWPEQFEFKTITSSERSRVHKFTVKVDGADREVYVKEYLFKSVLHSLKCLFWGSPAKQAFKAETMLAENGFDVAKLIAMGECREGLLQTKNFLATFGIENALSVRRQVLSMREITTPQQLADWRKFIRDFGRTIGKMHAKGIVHGDLRLGNILTRCDDGLWRFFFIDNERTKKFRRLPFIYRKKNLVQINMGPHGIASNTDRMRFFAAYLAENSMSKAMKKTLITATLRRTAQRLDKETRIRSWLKRSLGTNYRYLRIDAEDLTAVFLRSFCQGAQPPDFLEKIDALRNQGQILKDDPDCLVCRLKWNNRDIVVKHYKHKGVVFSLFDTIGKSHAKRDWLNGNRLGMMNVPVPQTLAFIERRRAGLVWESYIVSEHIENRETDNSMRDDNAARQKLRTY